MSRARIINVFVVNCDPNEASTASEALRDARRFVAEEVRASEAPAAFGKSSPDVIVVEFGALADDAIQTLTQIRYVAAATPIILVSYDLPADAVRSILKFNVHDWLKKPLDNADFKNVLASAAKSQTDQSNSVHAVISCVGGAGATSLAISMADIINRKLAKKDSDIALFDLDFSSGDCGNMLNLHNKFDLTSVAAAPRKIDSEFLQVIQKQHESGFFLYSFKRPSLNTNGNAYELVLRLLDAVSLEHEITFVDIPYYATEWHEDVIAAVNSFTLVAELNLPALKHTLDQIDIIKGIRGDDAPIHVIINKRQGGLFKNRLSKRKIRELLGETPFTFLPAEYQLLGEAMDRGVLPSTISRRSAFLKVLAKYLSTLPLKARKA